MKIIFLDVDGVLCIGNRKPFTYQSIIESSLLTNLRNIVKETEAQIVISSDWRFWKKNMDYLYDTLNEVGLFPIGETPKIHSMTLSDEEIRIKEISCWLKGHQEVKKWVAIDDLSLDDLGESFFRTQDTIGLTIEIAEQVIGYLKE